ncbi:hypothetical protein Pcinc_033404 [Petrolisthes cinctipes]|uniref:Uncharacterized protein n=1 Tax=Petrolisthes cinctipes TaxID=88211 RepID=A0AAE1ESH5_PETCI|nr:hypothetical protein Pcinc_033404 [Petrolisthes cinctipes]
MSPSSFLSFKLLTSFFSLHFLTPSSFLPIFSPSLSSLPTLTPSLPITYSHSPHYLIPISTHSRPLPTLTPKNYPYSLSNTSPTHSQPVLPPTPLLLTTTPHHQPLTPHHQSLPLIPHHSVPLVVSTPVVPTYRRQHQVTPNTDLRPR